MPTHPADHVDTDRYPLDRAAADPARGAVVDGLRAALSADGVAALPGFLRPGALAATLDDVDRVLPLAHLEDVRGTPYLAPAQDGWPDGHPRRTEVHSRTLVLAYDLVPSACPVRELFEWDAFLRFVGDVVGRGPLHRMDDPLGALNLTVMEDGHVQGWHYDSCDFVVSLALRAPAGGGRFECAAALRTPDDERYEDVADVLAGRSPERVDVYPMTPGTLMVFEGRRSLHRVSPVEGSTPRVVALFGFSTEPGTCSSEHLRRVRYGRTGPLAGGSRR